jgi:hypothetical protein
MKPIRPIQAEIRIHPKSVRSVNPERARAQARRRVSPSTTNVDVRSAVEHAKQVGATRRSP